MTTAPGSDSGGRSVSEDKCMPRLFIAIDVPREIKEQLCRLRVDIPGTRWVPMEQLHLTLAFLGEVDCERTARLMEGLGAVRGQGFELGLGPTGCFSGRKRPRVLWVGIKPEPLLMALVERVRAECRGCLILLEERLFIPHITLARIKEPGGGYDYFLDYQSNFHPQMFSVREFILFESRLSARGAQHITLGSYPLFKPA